MYNQILTILARDETLKLSGTFFLSFYVIKISDTMDVTFGEKLTNKDGHHLLFFTLWCIGGINSGIHDTMNVTFSKI